MSQQRGSWEAGRPLRSRRLRMFVALIVSSAVLSGACGSDNEPSGVNEVAASGETEPVLHHADAADDPAIWVHPSRPGRSLVIGTDKVERWRRTPCRGGACSASVRSTRTTSMCAVGGRMTGTHRRQGDALLHGPTPNAAETGRTLRANLRNTKASTTRAERKLYAVVPRAREGGAVEIDLSDGRIEGSRYRAWDLGRNIESCVADDSTGKLYISEKR